MWRGGGGKRPSSNWRRAHAIPVSISVPAAAAAMDRPPEGLQQLALREALEEVLEKTLSIPEASPRTFALITLVLVFPLSIAVLVYKLFTYPILHRLETTFSSPSSQLPLGAECGHPWALLFLYLLFLLTFALLATAAVALTVASIYAAKPVSFLSTLNAIPPVFSRLVRTSLWVSLIMFVYNSAYCLTVILFILVYGDTVSLTPDILLVTALFAFVFLSVRIFISALCHLATVITVLEPVCGLAAMKKSRELLQGRTRMALVFGLWHFSPCNLIAALFAAVAVRTSPMVRVLVGGALVAVLVVVNLFGLLVQSVFYYVCKSYHHQSVDKKVSVSAETGIYASAPFC